MTELADSDFILGGYVPGVRWFICVVCLIYKTDENI